MYFPEFSITTNILNNIGKIEASKALIEHLPLFPAWENSLQLEAKIKNAFHANHFEGNSLNFDHVKGFFNGRDVTQVNKRGLKEIENYQKALNLIPLDLSIDEQTLKSFHKILLRDIAPENKTGIYRTTVFLGSSNLEVPKPDEILAQLRSFFTWFGGSDALELPAPLRSAILYFEILRISPFETENKKIAGLITNLNLRQSGYDNKNLLAFEGHFDESQTAFNSIIRSTQNQEGDITRWLEYFLSGLANEFMRMKEKILNLSKDNKVREVAGMTPLNERQERIIEYLSDYGNLKNKDFIKLFPEVSEDTILRDLKDLIAKNLIIKTGSTKSSRYSPVRT
ncbi:hypothetical protein A2716_01900 [candidate division WWE3 bacterium RIFCSPHIGHO2_01_FULL_40_23]|uniref:Fido domain-containing protein n=1 Tax=candidate division WWE3 bacterium RIFCSPLOWO2_01_FULL_41_18 TaxID=1802625 RepID=A0A1F4VGB0_UNCKA|nr:MAG: hypothetical protein A2716_01900 [candidate division WWE3 bacterium RIFCSPHIGHO2_01_FULL_40_23]OGC55743.1 MAG: hypothetical protein A3A78_01750 [candidate division WWE3 bacterium RIFCSPLOWO2_01_FULL_41_18]